MKRDSLLCEKKLECSQESKRLPFKEIVLILGEGST